ncbi:Peptidylprolyl isomerase [Desulfarculus baarsii DSM 2075]|uniref:Peptidyl-prolyl cis-trans isomerase n=1 Tax=Desulfarculus baarsii (strain ATCC 33931 / DSM 2075 / LMG 7858 / VKM B-1802 / 2st14) TaxID=644282 RepID=E1QL41_DESB2|nr:peptidylprolyl isomerase [Desulfarculus baarsii]ADK85306.1 Peptidylprolyl isomerase [Desulfarculus baarsii DSM 2075]
MRRNSLARRLGLAILAAVVAAFCISAGVASAQVRQGENPMVKFTTSMGDIVIELYPDKAPITVQNFLNYVNKGHYAGTVFHRVVPGFVIQGGGLRADMGMKATDKPIKNEADNGLKNTHYSLSMARTQIPDSATCQFFINLADNEFLDHTAKTPDGWGYAVFGKVVEGQDVVDKIGAVKTGNKGHHSDVPLESVVIEKAEVLEK